MGRLAVFSLLLSTACWGQQTGELKAATTNVWAAAYPRVDDTGRAQVRIKAPAAWQVKLNFWSGPKVDMVRESDGFWTVTTAALVPGLRYYTLIMDGAEDEPDPSGQGVLWRRQVCERRGSSRAGHHLLLDRRRAPRASVRGGTTPE